VSIYFFINVSKFILARCCIFHLKSCICNFDSISPDTAGNIQRSQTYTSWIWEKEVKWCGMGRRYRRRGEREVKGERMRRYWEDEKGGQMEENGKRNFFCSIHYSCVHPCRLYRQSYESVSANSSLRIHRKAAFLHTIRNLMSPSLLATWLLVILDSTCIFTMIVHINS